MSRWSFDEGQKTGELVVTGAVTVAQVGELKELLLAAIEQAPLVQVDLGQVEQIDIAGVQLFCAAHRLAGNRGGALVIKTFGVRVRELIVNSGFAHTLRCDHACSSACLWGTVA